MSSYIKYNLKNVNINPNDRYLETGIVTFRITSNTNYVLGPKIRIIETDESGPDSQTNDLSITIDENLEVYSFDLKIKEYCSYLIENIGIEHKKTTIPLILQLENCSIEIDSTNNEIPIGLKNFKLIANEGFIFSNNGYYVIDNNPSPEQKNIILANNEKELEVKITDSWQETPYSFTVNMVAVKKSITSLSNFINIYKVTDNELNSLALERYYDDSVTGERIDYGAGILNLFITPLKVENETIKDNIQLQDKTTSVKSSKIIERLVTIDMGQIEVNEKYHNVFDYKNITIIAKMPFSKEIELNVTNTMNHILRFEYVLNLYDGTCNRNIYDEKENVIYNDNVLMSEEIPYIQFYTNNSYNNLKSTIYNSLNSVQIEITRNIPISDLGFETNVKDLLKNVSGYIEGNIQLLKTNATSTEQEEIKTLLRNGVII